MKQIPNFPDYFADKGGNIYSIRPWGRNAKPPKTPRKLKPALLEPRREYYYVVLRRNGRGIARRIHRLILETFVGQRPEGMECCHGRGGKLDNSLSNLCWGTKTKNHGEDKLRDGTSNRGEKHGRSKLNRQQVLRIRSLAGRVTQKKIAEMFNVGRTTVNYIINRKNWFWL